MDEGKFCFDTIRKSDYCYIQFPLFLRWERPREMLVANYGYIWAAYCPLQRFCGPSLTERGIARDAPPNCLLWSSRVGLYDSLSDTKTQTLSASSIQKVWHWSRDFLYGLGCCDSCDGRNANQSCLRSGHGMLHRNLSLGREAVEDS